MKFKCLKKKIASVRKSQVPDLHLSAALPVSCQNPLGSDILAPKQPQWGLMCHGTPSSVSGTSSLRTAENKSGNS